jgi:hypothetical protein
MTRRIRLGVAAVAVAALTGLAGCHGESPTTPSAAASGLGEDQLAAILQEYTQCIRDHGIAGFRSPKLVDGRIQGRGQAPAGVDEATLRAALEACEPIAQRVPDGMWGRPEDPTAAQLEQLRQLAACLRQHGFPDWPDPDTRGRFAITGTPMEQAVKGDSGRDAFAARRQYNDGDPIRMTEPR